MDFVVDNKGKHTSISAWVCPETEFQVSANTVTFECNRVKNTFLKISLMKGFFDIVNS